MLTRSGGTPEENEKEIALRLWSWSWSELATMLYNTTQRFITLQSIEKHKIMSQVPKRGWLASLSPIQRTILGLVIIALVTVVGVIYGPHYDDSNTTTGDAPPTTVTVTGLTSSLVVNRSVVYKGVTITVTNVAQARSFSDDGKSQYAHTRYVLRVYLHVQAPKSQQGALGIDYPNLVRLILNDGAQLHSGMVHLSPDMLPGQDQSGFMDFWVNTEQKLSSLTFTLGGNAVAFGG